MQLIPVSPLQIYKAYAVAPYNPVKTDSSET